MKKYILYALLIVLISCNGGAKPFEKRLNKVFGEDVFRGLSIGDSYNKVLKTENKDFMQFPDSNIIKYMYHVSDTEEYHWAYIFEDDKIKKIQFDAYLGEPSDGKKYVELIEKRYTKILGAPDHKLGGAFWSKGTFFASLFDESQEAMMGKVRFVLQQDSDSTSTQSLHPVHKADFKIYQDE